jgi:hypothetical protein
LVCRARRRCNAGVNKTWSKCQFRSSNVVSWRYCFYPGSATVKDNLIHVMPSSRYMCTPVAWLSRDCMLATQTQGAAFHSLHIPFDSWYRSKTVETSAFKSRTPPTRRRSDTSKTERPKPGGHLNLQRTLGLGQCVLDTLQMSADGNCNGMLAVNGMTEHSRYLAGKKVHRATQSRF